MDKVQALKNAIAYAKQNPDSELAVQLRQRIESGVYKNELAQIKMTPFEPVKETGGDRVKADLARRGDIISDTITDPNKGALEKGLDVTATAFGAIPATVINNLPKPVRNVLDKIGKKIGAGFEAVAEKIGDTQLFKEAVANGDTSRLEQALSNVSSLGEIAGVIATVEGGTAGVQKIATKVETVAPKIVDATKTAIPKVIDKAKSLVTKTPEQLTKDINQQVSKVLPVTGKKTLGNITSTKTLDNATNAFETIRQNSPKITIKDLDGAEKVFDPKTTNAFEIPQALQQTKQAVYNEFSSIAQKAGDAGLIIGKKDFKELNNILKKYQGKGYTNAFASKAKSLQNDLAKYKGKATPEEMQQLIERVNIDVNPLSDKAGSQVATEFSKALRTKLDSKLEASGNPQYQAVRNKYAELKSIEQPIIDMYKKALREANAKPALIDHITNMDTLYGVLSGNLIHVGVGTGIKLLNATTRKLFGAEARLRNVFKLLEERAGKATPEIVPVVEPVASVPKITKKSLAEVKKSRNADKKRIISEMNKN